MAANEEELATRLAHVADLLNDPAVGPDSPTLENFIRQFPHDKEFIELAGVARRLKRNYLSKQRKAPPVMADDAIPTCK